MFANSIPGHTTRAPPSCKHILSIVAHYYTFFITYYFIITTALYIIAATRNHVVMIPFLHFTQSVSSLAPIITFCFVRIQSSLQSKISLHIITHSVPIIWQINMLFFEKSLLSQQSARLKVMAHEFFQKTSEQITILIQNFTLTLKMLIFKD